MTNGKICYLEIPAVDIEPSARFFENVPSGRGEPIAGFLDPAGNQLGLYQEPKK